MKIIIKETCSEVDAYCAFMAASVLVHKKDAVLGCATGNTTLTIYKALTDLLNRMSLSCNEASVFAVDEYEGITHENPISCRTRLFKQLVSNIDMPESHLYDPISFNVHGLESKFDNLEDYDKLIEQLGGFDFQLLGVGANGHIGFNEPGSEFGCKTHKVRLSDGTRKVLKKKFLDQGMDVPVPENGITLGIKSIMQSRRILIVAKGEAKRVIVRKILHGPVTCDVPASILQLHPSCVFVMDKEAAEEL